MEEKKPEEDTKNRNIVIIGGWGSGKTSIIQRIVFDTFSTLPISTIGIGFYTIDFNNKGEKIKLRLFDTAGQECYDSINKQYIRSGKGIILTFSVCERMTFDKLDYWYDEINFEYQAAVIFATQIDRISEKVVSEDEYKTYAKQKGLKLFEVSSKIGKKEMLEGIEELVAEMETKKDLPPNVKQATENKKGCC
jgi:small GTP-binding protein